MCHWPFLFVRNKVELTCHKVISEAWNYTIEWNGSIYRETHLTTQYLNLNHNSRKHTSRCCEWMVSLHSFWEQFHLSKSIYGPCQVIPQDFHYINRSSQMHCSPHSNAQFNNSKVMWGAHIIPIVLHSVWTLVIAIVTIPIYTLCSIRCMLCANWCCTIIEYYATHPNNLSQNYLQQFKFHSYSPYTVPSNEWLRQFCLCVGIYRRWMGYELKRVTQFNGCSFGRHNS